MAGGRPPVEALSPPGTSRRLASSASTRWATVERARPVSGHQVARAGGVAGAHQLEDRPRGACRPVRRRRRAEAEPRATVNQRNLWLSKVESLRVRSVSGRIFRLTIDRSCRKDDRRGGSTAGVAGDDGRSVARRDHRRRLHRCRARPRRAAGGRPGGRGLVVDPGEHEGRRRASRRRAGLPRRRHPGAVPRHRRRAHLHAEPPARPSRPPHSTPASTWSARSRWP